MLQQVIQELVLFMRPPVLPQDLSVSHVLAKEVRPGQLFAAEGGENFFK